MKKCIRRLLGILFFVLVSQVMLSATSVFAAGPIKTNRFYLNVDYYDHSRQVYFTLRSPQFVAMRLSLEGKGYLRPNESVNISLYESNTKIQTKKVRVTTDNNIWFFSNRKLSKGSCSFVIDNLSEHSYEAYCAIFACPSFSTSITPSSRNVTIVAGDDINIPYRSYPSGTFCALRSVRSSNTQICEAEWDGDDDNWNEINIYGNNIGKAVVYVRLHTGKTYPINVTVIPPSKPHINDDAHLMYIGEKVKLVLYHKGKGKVKWRSSKPSVATVSSKGVVKAKKIGECRITATYQGKTYARNVSVVRERPDFCGAVINYDLRGKCFIVDFTNYAEKKSLTILSGTKVVHDEYSSLNRKIRLKKKVKIPAGSTKKVKFYVKGTSTSYRYGEFTLTYKFKFDGETYTGEVQDGLSGYIKKGNWVKSYWDSKLYANWLNNRHFVRY